VPGCAQLKDNSPFCSHWASAEKFPGGGGRRQRKNKPKMAKKAKKTTV